MKFGKAVIKSRIAILIVAIVLLIPSVLGMIFTRVNYDMLNYLPDSLDTIKGQDYLLDDFDKGAFSFLIFEDMNEKDIVRTEEKIKEIDHIVTVLWYDDIADMSIPMEVLPDKIYDAFNSDNSTLMAVFFDTSSSADETMDAITQIRAVVGEQCFVSGISAMVAVVEKSISLPIILVAVIELAIFINLGLPHYMGESLPFIAPICISTIQLGATVDYAILMTTRYKKERSLGNDKRTSVTTALETSIPSIIVSAMGLFAATVGVAIYSDVDMIGSLCALMARGAIISALCVILILPAMFMLSDKVIGATTLGFKSNKNNTEVTVNE